MLSPKKVQQTYFPLPTNFQLRMRRVNSRERSRCREARWRNFGRYRRSLVETRIRYLVRMSELDERGILFNCPKCGRCNRMRYEGLGKTFRCGQCQSELEPVGEPVDVHNDLAFEALISHSAVPVLVDFGRLGVALAKWWRRKCAR